MVIVKTHEWHVLRIAVGITVITSILLAGGAGAAPSEDGTGNDHSVQQISDGHAYSYGGIPGAPWSVKGSGNTASASFSGPVLIPFNTTYEPLSGGIANEVTPNFTLNVGIIDTGTGINTANVIADVSSVSTAGTVLMALNGSLAGIGQITYFNKTVKVDKVVRGVFNVTVTAYDNSSVSGSTNLIVVAFMYPGVKVIGYNSSKNFPAYPSNASMFYNNSPVEIIVNTIDKVHYSSVTANFFEADGSIPLESNNSGVLLSDGNYSYRITHTLGIIPNQDVRIVWINVTMSTAYGPVTIPKIGALVVVSNMNPKEDASTGLGGSTTNFRDIPDYSAAYLVFEPFISTFTPSTGSTPSEQWNRTFGGANIDRASSVLQTSDGGYITAGSTKSYGAGGYDVWLIKTDSSGSQQWNKTYGGKGDDWAGFYGGSLQQTSDGGYIIAGHTESYGATGGDAWLIKTDSSGNQQWNKTYGGGTGSIYQWASSARQTSDGGYIIVGKRNDDVWLIKTDSSGTQQWSKTFGAVTDVDEAYSVQQTSDGRYIIAGCTSYGGSGNCDAWLIKTDSSGNQQWNKKFGGAGIDNALSVRQTSDGGYILTGYTGSYGSGGYDAWLIKTDSSGNEQWRKMLGGTGTDWATSVQQTSEGGYILSGYTSSYGSGGYDAWLIKTYSNGTQQWSKTFGGKGDDYAFYVQQTSDGSYILAGWTYSYGAGQSDAWLIKVSSEMPFTPTSGKIATLKFNEPINLTDYTTAMNLKKLGEMLKMSGKSMNLNATANALREFNKAATLSIYNLTAFTVSPAILQDAVLKVKSGETSGGAVINLSWDNSTRTLSFNVSHWTEYSWDGEPPTVYPGAVGYPANQTTVSSGQAITLSAAIGDLFSGVKNTTVNAASIGAETVVLNSVDGDWVNTSVPVNASDGTYDLNITAYDNAGLVNNTAQIRVIVVNTLTSPALVSSITPNSRNVQVGTPATIFMSVINGGTANATNVSITQASSLPATVSYQQWNSTAFIGSANTPVDIVAGGTANFVLTINATSAFNSSSMTFNISSTNGATAPISGVNTLTISASAVPSADIIMMATGTLDYRTGVGNSTAFAVATSNVGTATASGVSFNIVVPSSITGLVTQVNETYPTNGTIKGPATGLTIAVGATPTFAVFLTPTAAIANDPANNRITLQLVDGSGKIIGAQSVAVSTT